MVRSPPKSMILGNFSFRPKYVGFFSSWRSGRLVRVSTSMIEGSPFTRSHPSFSFARNG